MNWTDLFSVNAPVSARGVFYSSFSEKKQTKQTNQILFDSRNIMQNLFFSFFLFFIFNAHLLFSLFFSPIVLKLTLSMSINWNVLLWNIGIFNKMDQSRCAIWTLLINTHIPLSSLTFSQKNKVIQFTKRNQNKKRKKERKNMKLVKFNYFFLTNFNCKKQLSKLL